MRQKVDSGDSNSPWSSNSPILPNLKFISSGKECPKKLPFPHFSIQIQFKLKNTDSNKQSLRSQSTIHKREGTINERYKVYSPTNKRRGRHSNSPKASSHNKVIHNPHPVNLKFLGELSEADRKRALKNLKVEPLRISFNPNDKDAQQLFVQNGTSPKKLEPMPITEKQTHSRSDSSKTPKSNPIQKELEKEKGFGDYLAKLVQKLLDKKVKSRNYGKYGMANTTHSKLVPLAPIPKPQSPASRKMSDKFEEVSITTKSPIYLTSQKPNLEHYLRDISPKSEKKRYHKCSTPKISSNISKNLLTEADTSQDSASYKGRNGILMYSRHKAHKSMIQTRNVSKIISKESFGNCQRDLKYLIYGIH